MSPHSFKGNVAIRQPNRSGGFTQADTRRPAFSFDQHGRRWAMSIDNRSGMPVGMNHDFHAPWTPDYQFVKVNPDNVAECWIDYQSMLRSRQAAWEDKHQRAVEYCRAKQRPEPKRYQYDEEVLGAIGGRNLKPLEPLIAAIQGNRWILGLTDVVDPRLERFVKRPTAEEALLDKYDFGNDPESNPAPWEEGGANDALDALVDSPEVAAAFSTAPLPTVDDVVADLQDEVDAEALGGRTVKHGKVETAKRQEPRRPGSSAALKGPSFKELRAQQIKGRKTMADGAMPVVSD